MPILFVSPRPLPFDFRWLPDEAQEASYLAASARTFSFRRTLSIAGNCRRTDTERNFQIVCRGRHLASIESCVGWGSPHRFLSTHKRWGEPHPTADQVC